MPADVVDRRVVVHPDEKEIAELARLLQTGLWIEAYRPTI